MTLSRQAWDTRTDISYVCELLSLGSEVFMNKDLQRKFCCTDTTEHLPQQEKKCTNERAPLMSSCMPPSHEIIQTCNIIC